MNWKSPHTAQLFLGIVVSICGTLGTEFPATAPWSAIVGAIATALLTGLGLASPSALQPTNPSK